MPKEESIFENSCIICPDKNDRFYLVHLAKDGELLKCIFLFQGWESSLRSWIQNEYTDYNIVLFEAIDANIVRKF